MSQTEYDYQSLKKTLESVLESLSHLRIEEESLELTNSSKCTSGAYSDVFQAALKRPGLAPRIVAVKELRTIGSDFDRIRVAIRLAREIRIWSQISHPNVLEFIGYHLNQRMSTAWLISPYVTDGNLLQFVENVPLDSPLRIKLMADTARGLTYLHTQGICHGDVKPANILVVDKRTAVIADFGLARFEDNTMSGLTTTRTIKGSLRYWCPELLEEGARHTFQSDVWAFGCIMMEILTGLLPYPSARNDLSLTLAMARGETPSQGKSLTVVEPIRQLLQRCWELEPHNRPTMRDCTSMTKRALQFMIFTATLTGGANVLEEIFVTDDMPAQYQNVLRPLITSKDIRFALWLWGSKHYVMYEELTVREKLLYQEDKEKIRSNCYSLKSGKSLYFVRSSAEDEAWVSLAEKAYFKLHNDYMSLAGGVTTEAIENLTGAISHVTHLNDITDYDKFWKEEIMANDRLFTGYMFGLNPPYLDQSAAESVQGLYRGHAYSILEAAEIRGKRFLLLRNQWGKGEYTGPWSDGNKEWTAEWMDVLDVMDHKFGEDGEFLMEYCDFVKLFTMISRSRVFNSSWMLSQSWIRVATWPFPSPFINYGDVCFNISIPKKTFAVIVFAQQDMGCTAAISGHALWSLDFAVFKMGETEPCATAEHNRFWGWSVHLETELDEGEYVVHVRSDRSIVREKDYFQSGYQSWNRRKLSEIRTDRTNDAIVECDFQPDLFSNTFPIPEESFRALTELEIEAHRKPAEKDREVRDKRKAAKAKHLFTRMEVVSSTTAMNKTEKGADGEVEERETKEEGEVISIVESAYDRVTVVNTDNSSDDVEVKAGPVVTTASPPKTKAPGIQTIAGATGLLAPALNEHFNPLADSAVPALSSSVKTDSEKTTGGYMVEKIDSDKEGASDTKKDKTAQPDNLSSPPSPSPGARPVIVADDQNEKAVHSGVWCDGCATGPLVGKRYKCLEVSCRNYDLCENCIKFEEVHYKEHKFLVIEAPQEKAKFDRIIRGEDNIIILGLRVYTHMSSPAKVTTQLRHGKL